MNTVVRKVYANYEKEERWLNEMAARGFALIDYSWCRYLFERCQPGEYIYRIELLQHMPSHPESRQYLEFMEESGAQPVTSYMRWVYFRKKAGDGPFDIYSDIDSRLRHYRRVHAMWLALSLSELGMALSNLSFAVSAYIEGKGVPEVNAAVAALLLVISALYFILGGGLRKHIRALKKERLVRG